MPGGDHFMRLKYLAGIVAVEDVFTIINSNDDIEKKIMNKIFKDI
jgi:hypothetical protein